jgi:hypothetical protein
MIAAANKDRNFRNMSINLCEDRGHYLRIAALLQFQLAITVPTGFFDVTVGYFVDFYDFL